MKPELRNKLRALIRVSTQGKIQPAHTDDEHWYIMPDGTRVASVTTQLKTDKPFLIKWAIKVAHNWLEENDKDNILEAHERLQGMQSAFENVRDLSSKLGNITHDALDKYIRHWITTDKRPNRALDFVNQQELSLLEQADQTKVMSLVSAAETAIVDLGAEPLASEILVGDSTICAAGTLDAVMLLPNGTIEIWDWKTSNFLSDDYAIQASAYKSFLEKMVWFDGNDTAVKQLGLSEDFVQAFRIAQARIVHLKKKNAEYESYLVHDCEAAYSAFDSLAQAHQYLSNDMPKLLPALESNKKIVKI